MMWMCWMRWGRRWGSRAGFGGHWRPAKELIGICSLLSLKANPLRPPLSYQLWQMPLLWKGSLGREFHQFYAPRSGFLYLGLPRRSPPCQTAITMTSPRRSRGRSLLPPGRLIMWVHCNHGCRNRRIDIYIYILWDWFMGFLIRLMVYHLLGLGFFW